MLAIIPCLAFTGCLLSLHGDKSDSTCVPKPNPMLQGMAGLAPAALAILPVNEPGDRSLYVAGDFRCVADCPARFVARFDVDTGTWHDLDFYSNPVATASVEARAIVRFPDTAGSPLYIGGRFLASPGAPATFRWDGQAWTPLAGLTTNGLPGVLTMESVDFGNGATLYAGGQFTAGGSTARLARLDGNAWVPVPAVGFTVKDLLATSVGGSPRLLACGLSTSILAFDGTAWTTFASSATLTGFVAMATFDAGAGESVYALYSPDSTTAPRLVRLDGGSMTTLHTFPTVDALRSMEATVDALGPALYIGSSRGRIYRWDGTAPATLIVDLDFYDFEGVATMVTSPFPELPGLIVGGGVRFDGPHGSAFGIGRLDEGVVQNFLDPDHLPLCPSYTVHKLPLIELPPALRDDDNSAPDFVPIGGFDLSGTLLTQGIAAFDGSAWQPLDVPFPWYSELVDMVLFDPPWDDRDSPNLYVTGTIYDGSIPYTCTAVFDGTQWAAADTGIAFGPGGGLYYGLDLQVVNFAGGRELFVAVDVDSVKALYRLTATGWTSVGSFSTTTHPVNALAAYDDGSGEVLIVGGSFTKINGVSMPGIASWNGSVWTSLDPTSLTNYAFAVRDEDSGPALYRSTQSGAPCASPIGPFKVQKRVNGAWETLCGGFLTAPTSLRFIDSGHGPELWAMGDFMSVGGVPSHQIAIWNGDEWRAPFDLLQANINIYTPHVRDAVRWDTNEGAAIWVGGNFNGIAPVVSPSLAKLDLVGVPAVTLQPTDLDLVVGAQASFSTAGVAIESDVSYRWYRDGVPLVDGDGLSGANAPTLVVRSADLSDRGSYSCLLSGQCGETRTRLATLDFHCPGDFDGDGSIGAADLATLIGAWGLPGDTDLDAGGSTGPEDLSILLGTWGRCLP